MKLLDFHKLRTAVQVNAYPGSGRELTHVEANLRDLLLASGLFETVEVEHTDDPDQLVVGLCEFNPHLSEQAIAERLEQLWQDRVRYPYWSAHSLIVESEHVEFEAATRVSSTGPYVTVHLVAQRAQIPAQRQPQD